MSGVPTRPEEHLLEKDSRLTFEAALPRAWVVRRIEDDYGIDSTVEIFTDEGERTGLFFNAQLKSTNETDLEKALGSIRFDRDKADYYRSLALPLLVVLYHAPSESLFARWFHAYNPHVAVPRKADTKTIRFQFYEEDRCVADTPALLETGLRGFLKFRSSELPLPLALAVTSDPEADPETTFDVAEVGLALRKALAPVADLIRIERREPAPDDPAVFVGRERTVIALGDVASVTADHDPPDSLEIDTYAANVAMCLGMALSYVGQPNLAAQIGAAVAETSSVIVDVDVALTLAETMHRAQRVREAVELAGKLDASDDEERRFAGQLMLTAELAQGRHLSDDERDASLTVAEERFRRCVARKDSTGAAAAAYSLGNLYKRLARAAEAIEWFETAPEHDSRYDDRGYYHSDLASVLFESGEYTRAAEHYGRSIELGQGDVTVALHADALLHTGRYDAALNRLDEYLAEDRGPEGAEWRLKHALLPALIERVGPEQDRQVAEASRLVEQVDLETTPPEAWAEAAAICDAALAVDACCAEAWFRLALLKLFASGEITEETRVAALAAAALHRALPGPWVNAAAFADHADTQQMLDIFYCGYRLAGADFGGQMNGAIREGEGFADNREELIALLEHGMAEVDRRERQIGFTLRAVGEDGQVHELVFGEAAGDGVATAASRPVARRPASFKTKTRRKRPGKQYGKDKKKRKRKR